MDLTNRHLFRDFLSEVLTLCAFKKNNYVSRKLIKDVVGLISAAWSSRCYVSFIMTIESKVLLIRSYVNLLSRINFDTPNYISSLRKYAKVRN